MDEGAASARDQRPWDGPALLAALGGAVSALAAHVDEINALNVFPVPDGDTGSNMLSTLNGAMAEASAVPVAERQVGRVASAFAFGALMGARGNSGVILSQFFRGLSDGLDSKPRIDGRSLADGLVRASEAANAAVGHPVEGTILTVSRDLSTAARETAEREAGVEAVLEAAVTAAAASVERTPDLLPILREAGVVDAGGRGLELLLRGALASARNEVVEPGPHPGDRDFPAFELPEELDEFGYETVYVVQPPPGERLVLAYIRDRLEQIGQSVVVAGDERAVKVHVHNDRPDQVLAFGLSLGTLSYISVENLDGQTREVRYAREHPTLPGDAGAAAGGPADGPVGAHRPALEGAALPRPRPGPHVVAVAAGAGFGRIFEGLGVTATVNGGQGANPSAGELAEAIRRTGATEVIVLPNNPNVGLAARQAAQLCPGTRLEVVPTRNPAEGIAAMLAFDATADVDANATGMLRSARSLQTMLVTTAVRDAILGGRAVARGEHIVLGPDDGLIAADTDRTAAVLAAVGALSPGFELLTLYHGTGLPATEAAELAAALGDALDGVEIEVIDGGQPHYELVISAE